MPSKSKRDKRRESPLPSGKVKVNTKRGRPRVDPSKIAERLTKG